jgi:hypothetical protein
LHYLLQHGLRLLKYLVIPETQNEKSLRLDQAVALVVVVGVLNMLTAIEFYDDLCLQTRKVRDESSYRHLPSKSVASDLAVTKVTPE